MEFVLPCRVSGAKNASQGVKRGRDWRRHGKGVAGMQAAGFDPRGPVV